MSLIPTIDIRSTREIRCHGPACGEPAWAEWHDPRNNTWYAGCWYHIYDWDRRYR